MCYYVSIYIYPGEAKLQSRLFLCSSILQIRSAVFLSFYCFSRDVVIYSFVFTPFPFPFALFEQETSILEEYNINWTQKLGAGISGPVR